MRSAASVMLAMSTLAFFSCEDDDVIGLDDATKYGFVKVTIEGEDPEGNDFKTTQNFKFFPSGAPYGSSSVRTYDDDGFYRYFDVERYKSPFDDGDDSSVYLDLEMQNEEDPFLSYGYFQLETAVTTKDNKFFALFEYINISEEDITSYKYNPETGKLNVVIEKELTNEQTNLGTNLTFTITVNVKVFENIGNDFEN